MKLKTYSSKRGFRAKKVFATLSLVAGLVGVASISNSTAVSAAGLMDKLTINPLFQQYLNDVNAGLGDKWVLIPDKYSAVINAEAGRGSGVSLPSSYNLVTAGYATTQKNQGGDGACWAYATTTAMESYLKKNKGVSIEFAPKQLDYVMTPATQYGAYLQKTYNVSRSLGNGGNFLIASLGLRSNYVVDREDVFFARMKANDPDLANVDSFRQYNDNSVMFSFGPYTKAMSATQIFGDKAEYIVDGFERIDKNDPDVVTKVKEKVYTSGAVYVGTYAPETEGCWDAATNTVVDRGSACDDASGHAMAIVGWDDSYAYTDPATHTAKTGAFIVQNSHGSSSLFSDYGFTADSFVEYLREHGALEGKTETEIQALKDAVNNWDAHEFVYLGYDFEKSESAGSIDFGAITSMTKNDFKQEYDVTKATIAENDGELIFKMKGDGEQLVSILGLDLVVPLGDSYSFKVGIDSNNDGVVEQSQTITYTAVESGRKTIKLADPVYVSGDFSVILALDGMAFSVGDEAIVSPVVYASDATGYIPVPNTSGAPNTGAFTKDGSDVRFGGAVVTLIGITIVIVNLTAFKNRKQLHRVKFEKK